MSKRLFQRSPRTTIRTKLLVGFCSIIVLLIISAMTSFLMNMRVGSLENRISEENRVLLSYKALSLDVGRAYHNGYLYMMSSFDSDKKRFNALYETSMKLVAADLAELQKQTNQSTAFQEIMSTWQEYSAANKEALATFEKGSVTQALGMYQYVPFDRVSKAIIQKADSLEKDIVDLKVKSNQAKSLSSWVNMLTILCSITCGLFLALRISSSISRSIRQLQQVSGQIANGDLSTGEIKADTNDEVADLVRATNVMVNYLREFVHIVNTASEQLAASSTQLYSYTNSASETVGQLHDSTEKAAEGASNQLFSAQEIANAMNEMVINIAKIAEHSHKWQNTRNKHRRRPWREISV
jgi:methyl-accepting chemotaxis protein